MVVEDVSLYFGVGTASSIGTFSGGTQTGTATESTTDICTVGSAYCSSSNEELKEVHEGKPDKHHRVHIEEQTLLHEIIGDEKGEINSAHHQAIGKLGEGLRVNCRAEDGTPEGIEWTDATRKPFLLAIQWHPERMYTFQLHDSPLSKNIREKFLEEIRKSKANRK